MADKKSFSELKKIYDSLDDERKAGLYEYAEFLLSKGGPAKPELIDPVEIPRPENETVVGAIKRLKETYPMIGSMTVFSSASALMTEHMINGRDAVEVINEMEELFEKSHQEWLRTLND